MQREKLEYRMFGLVPYNISEIQKGIQFAHGVVEYMSTKRRIKDTTDKRFGKKYKPLQQWIEEDKTFIILNGGTTNTNIDKQGSMNSYLNELRLKGIKLSFFREPDLGGQLTSINFLVDERVFNKRKYPDFVGDPEKNYTEYKLWIKSIGGYKNKFLREFLKKFRLA